MHTQLFNEISTSTNNSLNPRPELLLGTDETSLSRSAITSKILAPKEARVLWGCLLTSLSNSLHMEESKVLQSCELGSQISCDPWFSMLAFSQSWVILAVWARKAFRTPAKSLVLCLHILYLKMVCLHSIILEMGSFQMSVVKSFCDQP